MSENRSYAEKTIAPLTPAKIADKGFQRSHRKSPKVDMSTDTNTFQWTGHSQIAVNARWAEKYLLLISLVTVDLLAVLIGFGLAYILRFETELAVFYQHEGSQIEFYRQIVFFPLAPIWLIVFKLFGLYNSKHLFSGMREYAQIFNACTFGIMLVILFTFFDPTFVIARAWVVFSWVLVTVSVMLGRFLVRRLVQQMRVNGRFLTTVLIVGANDEGQAIARQLKENPKSGIWIAGIVDDTLEPGSEVVSGLTVLGSFDMIPTLVQYHGIQEIIVASANALPRSKLIRLFQTFGVTEEINIRMSSGLYELLTTGVEVQEFGNVPLLSVNKVRLTGAEVVLKTMLDILLTLLVLPVIIPLMIIIAIAIKLDSSGPAFYRRRVVGVGGKIFDALKFRTMHVNGDEILEQNPELLAEFKRNEKLKDDPRVTRLGRILRKTSLDELPQLFNVLLGQMSLVGPRMITEEERERYGRWRTNLTTVKPGITGLWQVSGRSDISYEERVMLDMHYIRNYSIWFDLYLLWQTVPAVLRKRGAY